MKPEDFKHWRKKMGLTQAQAAKVLGLSKPTIENYDKGVRSSGEAFQIPHVVALACAALWHKIEPWGSVQGNPDNSQSLSKEMPRQRIEQQP